MTGTGRLVLSLLTLACTAVLCTWITAASQRYAVTSAGRLVYRVDRRTGDLLVIHGRNVFGVATAPPPPAEASAILDLDALAPRPPVGIPLPKAPPEAPLRGRRPGPGDASQQPRTTHPVPPGFEPSP